MKCTGLRLSHECRVTRCADHHHDGYGKESNKEYDEEEPEEGSAAAAAAAAPQVPVPEPEAGAKAARPKLKYHSASTLFHDDAERAGAARRILFDDDEHKDLVARTKLDKVCASLSARPPAAECPVVMYCAQKKNEDFLSEKAALKKVDGRIWAKMSDE